MRAFYFGCRAKDDLGHHFYGPRMGHVRVWHGDGQQPFEKVDGGLAPKIVNGRQTEGVAQLHHKDGWTALAWWDRSGDSRPNSNAAFIIEGTWTFEQMVDHGKRLWPTFFERIDYELRPLMRYRTRDEAITVASEATGTDARLVIEAFEAAVREPVPAHTGAVA